MASERVLSMMATNTVYSHIGEVAKAQSLYCRGFLGMYRRTGLAFRANSMQFLWKIRSCLESVSLSALSGNNYLVLVKLAVLECGFSLRLEGDDNEADKDVDHEECNDDDVDEVEDGHIWTVVVLGTNIWGVGVNGDVENAERET